MWGGDDGGVNNTYSSVGVPSPLLSLPTCRCNQWQLVEIHNNAFSQMCDIEEEFITDIDIEVQQRRIEQLLCICISSKYNISIDEPKYVYPDYR
jgi:hypothetical protein